MEHLNRNMDRMMMHMYDEFPHPVIMMPGVVIIDHNSNNANTKKDNPENKKADTKK